MQNTKQIILSATLIAGFILFVIYDKQNDEPSVGVVVTPTQSFGINSDKTSSITLAPQIDAVVPAVSPVPLRAPIPPPVVTKPAPAPKAAIYKDGTFTGKVADAYFGNLQVRAVISRGKLSDVKFLEYPNDQPQTLEISNRSMPKLKSEAISSQSAKVDIISGATQTCEAFNESLADALLQASV